MTTYATPIANLNGSSRADLLEKEVAILTALTALQEALQRAFPHGRDYQISPVGMYERARKEAEVEFMALDPIRNRHEEIARALVDQA